MVLAYGIYKEMFLTGKWAACDGVDHNNRAVRNCSQFIARPDWLSAAHVVDELIYTGIAQLRERASTAPLPFGEIEFSWRFLEDEGTANHVEFDFGVRNQPNCSRR